jgi:hypothetical protein
MKRSDQEDRHLGAGDRVLGSVISCTTYPLAMPPRLWQKVAHLFHARHLSTMLNVLA